MSAFAKLSTLYGLSVTLEQAKIVATSAEATRNNWPVVIAIVDAGGNLVLLNKL